VEVKRKKLKLIISVIGLLLFIPAAISLNSRFSNYRQISNETLNLRYYRGIYHDSYSTTMDYEVSKPLVFEGKLPVCILLHGDNVGIESLNLVKRYLIENKYITYSFRITDFDIDAVLAGLNATLNLILQEDDVDPSRITIFGHSHGGLYATLFGMIRPTEIHGIVCGNFADWRTFFLHMDYLNRSRDYNIDLNLNTPSNIYFALNKFDSRFDSNYSSFITSFTQQPTPYENELIGDVSNGSARYFQISQSYFGHSLSIYDPTSIYDEVRWLNDAVHWDPLQHGALQDELSLRNLKRFNNFTFFLVGGCAVLTFFIFANIIWILSFQDVGEKKIKHWYADLQENWRNSKKRGQILSSSSENLTRFSPSIDSQASQNDSSPHGMSASALSEQNPNSTHDYIWKRYQDINRENQKFVERLEIDDEKRDFNYDCGIMKLSDNEFYTATF
jgi:hypothetical protein